MPDWSYRTVLKPLMLSLGEERARRLAVGVLQILSRTPGGVAFIDFLGHMRPDERLKRMVAGVELPGPIVLGADIDPEGRALPAFSHFGPGMIEVRSPNHSAGTVPVAVRREREVILANGARLAVVDDVAGTKNALDRGAAGIWIDHADASTVRELRAIVTLPGAIVAGGRVEEPADARTLLEAGADAVVVGRGLIAGGPGLIKRCNEAILSTVAQEVPLEPLTLDAGRRSWFWALAMGAAMFAGGVLAAIIGSTRVVMPYDESLCGLTRDQIISLNPRLLPFMAHDRLSLAGTMLSIGIFYASLAWCGMRRGEHWARGAIVSSAGAGFFTFFFFLGFEYFDPFHAFVTAILTQFTLLTIAMRPAPAQPPVADWHETPAWRAGQWGQLLFVMIGVSLTAAGIVISIVGCTSVFVATDLAFMRTTAAQLRVSYERLVPLVAHDRATLGGMLIANGIVIWLAAQWGMRAGARWLWVAFAWGGNIAFAIATVVHFAVGYGSPLHLAPAFAGWGAWNVALLLTRSWLAAPLPASRTATAAVSAGH